MNIILDLEIFFLRSGYNSGKFIFILNSNKQKNNCLIIVFCGRCEKYNFTELSHHETFYADFLHSVNVYDLND